MGNIWLAFGLTLIAGLSTGIGSLIAFFAKKDKYQVFIDKLRLFCWSNDLCINGGDIFKGITNAFRCTR